VKVVSYQAITRYKLSQTLATQKRRKNKQWPNGTEIINSGGRVSDTSAAVAELESSTPLISQPLDAVQAHFVVFSAHLPFTSIQAAALC
jgi:hypothetical protein